MRFLLTTIRVGLLAGVCSTGWAVGPCAGTPAAAVKAFGGQVVGESSTEGYRVTRVHRDAVLGTRWATVERCGHPEMPGLVLPAAVGAGESERTRTVVSTATLASAPKVIRPGETVRLWRRDANVRMEMAAVSEEGGATGDRIRMRVTTQQEFGEGVRYVYGLVRGPADVEME